MANSVPIRFSISNYYRIAIIFGIEKGNGEAAFWGEIAADSEIATDPRKIRIALSQSSVII